MDVSAVHHSSFPLNSLSGTSKDTLTAATLSEFLKKAEQGSVGAADLQKIPVSLRTFLMKAKNGTVGKADLQDIQAQLSKIPEDIFHQNPPNNEIGKFLAKVKAGTVTEEDLQKVKTALSNVPATE